MFSLYNPNSAAWLLVMVAAFCASAGNLLLKKSQMAMSGVGLISSWYTPWFLIALLFLILDLALFTQALKSLPISSVYPVFTGITFVSLTFLAAFFLGERLQSVQLLGVGLIILGIILVRR